MVASVRGAPQASVWTEVAVTQMMDYLRRLRSAGTFEGVKVSPLLVVSPAVLRAIRRPMWRTPGHREPGTPDDGPPRPWPGSGTEASRPTSTWNTARATCSVRSGNSAKSSPCNDENPPQKRRRPAQPNGVTQAVVTQANSIFTRVRVSRQPVTQDRGQSTTPLFCVQLYGVPVDPFWMHENMMYPSPL